jgi:hypothetical protein
VGLLALGLEIDAVGQPLVQQPHRLEAGGERKVDLALVEAHRIGRGRGGRLSGRG